MRISIALFALSLLAGCSEDPISRSLGAQCSTKSECDERCAIGEDFPDGLCTLSCESDRDCPDTAQCVDKEGGICLYSCRRSNNCEFLGALWQCEGLDSRQEDLEVNVCIGR